MKLNPISSASALLFGSVLLTACGEAPKDSMAKPEEMAVSTTSNPVTSNPTALWGTYESLATKIKEQHTSASFTSLNNDAQQLTRLSTELLPQFIEANEECKQYLSVAINSVDVMLNLSLEQIEADYHADGKLPAMNDVKCYHAKDLLVHPATVAVIANKLPENDESRAMIHDEIAEVLEHLKQVQQASIRN